MNKINIKEVLRKQCYITQDDQEDVHDSLDKVSAVVKSICEEVLNLAVKYAEGYYYDESGEECNSHISEFSILQIKDWIK